MTPGSKPNPYTQLQHAHPQSTLELLGVSPSTNNLLGNLSAAAGGGAALGAAGAASAAGAEAATGAEAGAAGTAAGNAAGSLASNIAKGAALGGIGAFLTSGNNWIRLGEVVAGVILVVMGLRTLAGGGPSISVTSSPIKKAAGPIKAAVKV